VSPQRIALAVLALGAGGYIYSRYNSEVSVSEPLPLGNSGKSKLVQRDTDNAASVRSSLNERHANNAKDPAIAGRPSWRSNPPQDIKAYDGPSDAMARNAFNEKISNEIGSVRSIPDARVPGYDFREIELKMAHPSHAVVRCSKKAYDVASLPDMSVIFVFHNEVWAVELSAPLWCFVNHAFGHAHKLLGQRLAPHCFVPSDQSLIAPRLSC
jgi:hypothetical protein